MQVRFHRTFEKRLAKCPAKIQEAVYERIEMFVNDPTHPMLKMHALQGAFKGKYSINVTGDYRAVFRKQEDGIVFVMLGTHSELYG